MSKRVTIGVDVAGKEQTKRDLQEVRAATESAGETTSESLDRHDAATRKAADGTERLSKATNQFDDSAKTAATGLLGYINPQLASMGNIAVDVAKGVGGISFALAGMLGVGAGLAALVSWLQKAAEQADKLRRSVEQAAKARREAAGGLQSEVAQSMEAAGVVGAAEQGRQAAALLMEDAVPRDLAIFGATAQAVGELTDEQVRHVIGAYVATGREGAFGHDQQSNREMIDRLLKYDSDRAAAALEAARRDSAGASLLELQLDRIANEARLRDTVIERLRKTGRYSDRDLEALNELASGVDPASQLHWVKRPYFPRKFALPLKPSGNSTATMEELLKAYEDEARRVVDIVPWLKPGYRDFREMMDEYGLSTPATIAGDSAATPRQQQPVIINNTTNVATQYVMPAEPAAQRKPSTPEEMTPF